MESHHHQFNESINFDLFSVVHAYNQNLFLLFFVLLLLVNIYIRFFILLLLQALNRETEAKQQEEDVKQEVSMGKVTHRQQDHFTNLLGGIDGIKKSKHNNNHDPNK